MTGSKEKYRSWIPHGFDYGTPPETEALRDLEETVRKIFRSEGYREIRLPMLDYAETFSITTRNSSENRIFETRDGDGEILAIRSDLTVQVVKAASHGRLGRDFPMRLSYIQPVFQDLGWGSGRKREIMQAGVEIVGDDSPDRFWRILELGRSILQKLGHEPRILYGDARFLFELFADVPDPLRPELSAAFHTKDTARIAELCRESNIAQDTAELLTEVPLVFGGREALEELKWLCQKRPGLLSLLNEADRGESLVYDFSLVRELTYYTGPVFEAYIPGQNDRVLTGGVYDDLFRQFSGLDRTACGFAIHLQSVLTAVSGH